VEGTHIEQQVLDVSIQRSSLGSRRKLPRPMEGQGDKHQGALALRSEPDGEYLGQA